METKEELEKKKNELENKKEKLEAEIREIEKNIVSLKYEKILLKHGKGISCKNCKFSTADKNFCENFNGESPLYKCKYEFCYNYSPDNRITELIKKNRVDGIIPINLPIEDYCYIVEILGRILIETPSEEQQEQIIKKLETIFSIH